MRILLISDYASPSGGAERVLLGLRTALLERGHDARIFASAASPMGEASFADYQCARAAKQLRGLTQIWNPAAYSTLKKVLADFRPEVVHVRLFQSELSASILALLRNVPTVYHAAWYRLVCPLGTKMLPGGQNCRSEAGVACVRHGCISAYSLPRVMAQMWLTQRNWGSVNTVVANSEATRKQLEESGVKVDEVIWNGVNERLAGDPHKTVPTVVFAGRLVWEKGVDVLLEAFERVVQLIPAAVLLIAGEGPERANLERITGKLGLGSRVTFLGMLRPEEMEERFREAWVQVVPSRWQEPFGLVAAEAMMRGTAVIVSDSGGLAEFVQDGVNGLHCRAGDGEVLAEAIIGLLRDPERARAMGEEARKFAMAHLNEQVFVDRILSLYQRMSCDHRKVEEKERPL
ncbi:MAG: glycosyltransferase family 4 protein [Acidobacteria bacterium]|nr:glycosyltransferase family 4 protein [Acidobacteriota bacterium]